MRQKVFITGGAGFIGSLLTVKFIQNGYDVVIYDAFKTFVPPWDNGNYFHFLNFRLRRINEAIATYAKEYQPLTIIEGDIQNVSLLRKSVDEHRPDIMVHLAAIPIADASKKFIEDMLAINLTGTTNTLNAAKDYGIKRYVYTSSSMAYGDFVQIPAPETHPTNPLETYGATKLCGEIMTKTFGEMFGLPYVIIRPCSVYGPTDPNRRIVQRFVESGLKNIEITLYDQGRQCLDFTYIEDVVEGFYLASTRPEAIGEIFNITSGVGRTLRELAEIVKKHFPNLSVVYKDSSDPVRRTKRGALDIAKARRVLGYEPKVMLEEGFSRYVKFYQQYITS